MADQKIKSAIEVVVKTHLVLDEQEARALNAITVYGVDEFLTLFYQKLGRSYLEEHEAGFRSLFKTIKDELPTHFARADRARKAFSEQ